MYRSPVSRERKGLGATYLLVRTLPTLTYQPCKWDGMGMHSLATGKSVKFGGKIQEKYRECWSILTILRGVNVTASSPNVLLV